MNKYGGSFRDLSALAQGGSDSGADVVLAPNPNLSATNQKSSRASLDDENPRCFPFDPVAPEQHRALSANKGC